MGWLNRNKDITACGIIILVILIRFYPFVFFGTQILSDSWKSYYPWRAEYSPDQIKTIIYDPNLEYASWFPMVRDEVWHGQFPNWNDKSFCGTPLYANHLIPIFHLPFTLALLFPGEMVFTAYSLLMALTGTLFFYWFLRNWRLGAFVSLFGALAFFLAGWQMYLYPPEVATLIWIPAILLFYDRFIDRGKLIDASLCAFCVGQLLIGGYPVYIAHFFYVFVAYFIWRRFHPAFVRALSTRKWILGIMIIALGGLLMSAVQNYPTWEYSKLTWRNLATEKGQFRTPGKIISDKKIELESESTGNGLVGLISDQLKRRMRVIVPSFFNDMDKSRNFTGPIIVLLALIGLFDAHRKFRLIKILLIIFAVFFFIPPLFVPFAKAIPGWTISALLPREVFFFLMFFMAALGLDAVLNSSKSKIWLSILMLVLFLTGYVARMLFLLTGVSEFDLIRWSLLFDRSMLLLYFIGSMILLIAMIFGRVSLNAAQKMWRLSLIAVFIVSGLIAHFYVYQYFADRNPMPFTDELKEIKTICGDNRIVRYFPAVQRISFLERLDYVLPPNIPSKFGFYDTLGYDNMVLSNINDYWEKIEPGSLIRQRAIPHLRDIFSLKLGKWIPNGAGAQYLIVPRNVNADVFGIQPGELIHNGDLKLYKLSGVPPTIRFADTFTVVDDWSKVPNLDFPPNHVLLEKTPELIRKTKDQMIGADIPGVTFQLETIRKTPGYLEIREEAPRDSILYIADTWHPRWRATVNNKEVEILKANVAFRAIVVPKGENTIRMWYDGIEVLLGGIISAFALVIVFIIGFIDCRFSGRKP